MADINKNQIKIMSSEVLADTDDGGGQMTSNEIVSGNVNNMFPSISRLNRISGDVGLRKGFLSVQTDTRALFLGAHVSLTKQTSDPRVSVILFSTKDWFDTRNDCQTRIEGYLVKGPMYACGLWGDHYSGSKTIQVFVEEEWSAPSTGEVLVLIASKNLDGQSIAKKEQFVRITDVKEEIKAFIDESGNAFTKKVLYISFGDKLLFDLPGTVPIKSFRYSSALPTLVHTSVAADTSKYYGVSILAVPASKNALQIKVDEIRKPLVPSAQSQFAVTDFGVGMSLPAVLQTSATNEIVKNFNHNKTKEYNAGFAIAQTSLNFEIGGDVYTDNGKGEILNSDSVKVGVIDYGEGILTFDETPYNGTITAVLKALPAVTYGTPTETGTIPVSDVNRGYVYVFNCMPIPVKGTIRIDFLSSGKWYSLFDKGTGEIRGLENGIGSGNINFDTGSVSVTLGGLPDIGSNIIVYWGTKAVLIDIEQFQPDTIHSEITFALSEDAAYGSINIQMNADYRIYDSGDGTLIYENTASGGSGVVGKYIKRIRTLKFTVPELDIQASTVFPVAYNKYSPADIVEENIAASSVNDSVVFTLTGTEPVLPHTLKGNYPLVAQPPVGFKCSVEIVHLFFEDDGNGNIVEAGTSDIVGTVNYNTREISLNKTTVKQIPCFETFYGAFY